MLWAWFILCKNDNRFSQKKKFQHNTKVTVSELYRQNGHNEVRLTADRATHTRADADGANGDPKNERFLHNIHVRRGVGPIYTRERQVHSADGSPGGRNHRHFVRGPGLWKVHHDTVLDMHLLDINSEATTGVVCAGTELTDVAVGASMGPQILHVCGDPLHPRGVEPLRRQDGALE